MKKGRVLHGAGLFYRTTSLAKTSLDPAQARRILPPRIALMRIVRTVLAFFIAASVALLPVAGAAALNIEPTQASMSMDMSDCCPPEAMPCDKASGNCASMAACVSNSFGLTDVASSDFIFPAIRRPVVPFFATENFQSQTGELPFRPPRA